MKDTQCFIHKNETLPKKELNEWYKRTFTLELKRRNGEITREQQQEESNKIWCEIRDRLWKAQGII